MSRYEKFGWFATIAYLIGIVTKGSIEMSYYGNGNGNAQGDLNRANDAWNAANNDHETRVGALNYAHDKIANAGCFMEKYDAYLTEINGYCNPPKTTNSLSDLTGSYGINIIQKQNAVSTSTRQGCDLYPVIVPHRSCNSEGYCTTTYSTIWLCRYYTITLTSTVAYGTTITGLGSMSQMDCGMFTHGVAVKSREYFESSTGVVGVDKYTERKTDTYGSEAIVEIKVDNAVTPAVYKINAGSVNYQGDAAAVLNIIKSQCQGFFSALKTPAHYGALINATEVLIPGLRVEEQRTREILDAATAVKNDKQAKFNNANGSYTQSLSLWLPLIFVPPTVWLLILYCCIEPAVQEGSCTDLPSSEDCSEGFRVCCNSFTMHKQRMRSTPKMRSTPMSSKAPAAPPPEPQDDAPYVPRSAPSAPQDGSHVWQSGAAAEPQYPAYAPGFTDAPVQQVDRVSSAGAYVPQTATASEAEYLATESDDETERVRNKLDLDLV